MIVKIPAPIKFAGGYYSMGQVEVSDSLGTSMLISGVAEYVENQPTTDGAIQVARDGAGKVIGFVNGDGSITYFGLGEIAPDTIQNIVAAMFSTTHSKIAVNYDSSGKKLSLALQDDSPSDQEVNTAIASAISQLKNGVTADADTLSELNQKIVALQQQVDALGSGGESPSITLNNLTLANATFANNVAEGAVISAIQNKTAGSTVTTADDRFTVSGSNLLRGLGAVTSGSTSVALVETLAGATNTPRTTTIPITITQSSSVLALDTPMLFEGDSNTAFGYGAWNWAWQTLVKTQGRFYVPTGGNFAVPGATLGETGNGNSVEARKPALLARITELVAEHGACLINIMIGTNGGNWANDEAIYNAWVLECRNAGATVVVYTCPVFTSVPNSYQSAMNSWLLASPLPDAVVDVNSLALGLDDGGGKTHYTAADTTLVANLAGQTLNSMIESASTYSNKTNNLIEENFAGSVVASGAGVSGNVATGWTASRLFGDGNAVLSKTQNDAQQITVTAGVSDTMFKLSRNVNQAYVAGDVLDGILTMALSSVTDLTTVKNYGIGAGASNIPTPLGMSVGDPTAFANADVYRTYAQAASSNSSTTELVIYLNVEAGKSATITVEQFIVNLAEQGATIAPSNTILPILTGAIVGEVLTATNGSWTGTTPITFSQQFYLDELPVTSPYTLTSNDVGKTPSVFVTADNGLTATVEAVGDVVTSGVVVTGASFDDNVTITSAVPIQPVFSNSNKTLTRTNSNFNGVITFSPSATGKASGKYFMTATAPLTDNDIRGLGVSNLFASVFDGGANRTVAYANGFVQYNTGSLNIPSWQGAGNKLHVAIDLDNNLIWFRTNLGDWNNNASANPATGTGGIDISNITTDVHFFGQLPYVDGTTLTVDTSDMTDAPAGFGVWD